MEIYTDGSHSLKPRMSGVGAVILNNGKEHQIGGYTDRCADNNVAEVIAIAYAIKYIKDHKIVDNTKDKNIIIYSDSANALRKIHQLSPGKDEFEQQALDFIQDFLQTTSKKVTLSKIFCIMSSKFCTLPLTSKSCVKTFFIFTFSPVIFSPP